MNQLRGIIAVCPADEKLTRAAVQLRLKHAIPYADAFAAALGSPHAVLVTADRDFERVPGLRVLWLPPHETRSHT